MSQEREQATRRKVMRVAVTLTGMTGLAGGAVAGGAVLTAAPAYAATDGQHVEVCGGGLHTVSVSGPNQNGHTQHTGRRTITAKDDCYTFTKYWFKGNVTAGGTSLLGHPYLGSANVPTRQTANVFKITIGPTPFLIPR